MLQGIKPRGNAVIVQLYPYNIRMRTQCGESTRCIVKRSVMYYIIRLTHVQSCTGPACAEIIIDPILITTVHNMTTYRKSNIVSEDGCMMVLCFTAEKFAQ